MLESIKKNPYEMICDYTESIYPHTGKEVFEVLSLVPCSLILPDISYFSKTIRTNMNVLFLTLSGGAKSSLCKQFATFSYFPIEARSYTPAGLEKEIEAKPVFSLIIEDYATMAQDERILKIIEGIIGEEKVLDRHTTKKNVRKSVEGIGLFCGVPADLSSKLTSGTIFRTICLVVMHTDEEHSEIGLHINRNIGDTNNHKQLESDIRDYYTLLQEIQAGKHKEHPPVLGYDIQQMFKDALYKEWNVLTRVYRKNAPFNFFRELHDGYRMLVSLAFLNYFNRTIKDGMLVVEHEDCKIAVSLMRQTLQTKYELLMSEKLGKSVKNINQLQKIMKSNKIPQRVKALMPMHLKGQLNK